VKLPPIKPKKITDEKEIEAIGNLMDDMMRVSEEK